MKILLISNMYPSATHPGYGVFIKNFVDTITERGADVDLAVIQGKQRSKLSKVGSYLIFTLKIYKFLFTKKYDTIYVHYLAHSLLPLVPLLPFLKSRLILNAHGEDLLPRTAVEKIIFKLNKNLIRSSPLIVVPSEFFKSIAATLFPTSNIYVSPSGGIDLKTFYPLCKRTNEGDLIVGYVSRIDPNKGWDTLLEALHELSITSPRLKFRALFAGSGTQLADFHQKIKTLNLCDKVDYLGPIEQKDLPSIYARFDVFIFPTKLPESLGLVGLEALACGVPAICSSIGGINTYMLNGVNGFVFAPGNCIELKNRIEQYVGLRPSDREAMKTAAVHTATAYDRDIVADKIIKKMRDVIKYEN